MFAVRVANLADDRAMGRIINDDAATVASTTDGQACSHETCGSRPRTPAGR